MLKGSIPAAYQKDALDCVSPASAVNPERRALYLVAYTNVCDVARLFLEKAGEG